MLQIDVVTLFPPMFEAVTGSGVTGRARERKVYELVLWNPRDFAANAYRAVDDRPYGGGPGMVMMVEPLEKTLFAAAQRQKSSGVRCRTRGFLTPLLFCRCAAALNALSSGSAIITIPGPPPYGLSSTVR